MRTKNKYELYFIYHFFEYIFNSISLKQWGRFEKKHCLVNCIGGLKKEDLE